MANRYWVGGTGSWDGTAGTKWATTSGGVGGAAVPTTADTVFFDAASGLVTVTIAAGNTGAGYVYCTGFLGTLTGTAGLTTSTLVLVSGMNFTYTGGVTFPTSGTGTLTSAGKTLYAVALTGGGTLSLGSALTVTTSISISSGTFNTNNYNVTAGSLSSSGSSFRTINLTSSTVTLTGSGTSINFATATNLTLNAGTSQINITSTASPAFQVATTGGLGVAFYNVSFTGINTSNFSLTGQSCSFNNLSFAGRTSAGISVISLSASHTLNGTLTLSAGTNATMRTFVRSDTIGTTRTLTCAAVATLTDIDFRDITIAGAAAPVIGDRLGDCKGNSGITFPEPKTVYWNLAGGGGGNWSSVAWALLEGGAVSSLMFPLAQDTAVFPSAVPSTGQTVTINAAYNIGTIDMSARTSNTMTLACTVLPIIYGNWRNGTGTALSGTGTLTFSGRGSQAITSAGKTFTQGFSIDTVGGVVSLVDAFTTNRTLSTAFSVINGTFNANSYNITLTGSGSSFRADNSNIKTVALGAGTLTIAGTGGWSAANPSVTTVTGTGTISLTSGSAKNFLGGGIQTYPTLNQGGAGTITIVGSNKFKNITNTYTGGPTGVLFTSGTTNEFEAFNLTGQATRVFSLGTTVAGQATLKKPTPWNVGVNSTNNGNNTGLTFAAGGGIDYLSISYINGVLPFVGSGNFFAFF